MQRIFLLGLLTNLGLVATAAAQVPTLPAAPAAPAAPASLGGAPAAPQSNLWSYLCLTPDQKASCTAMFCQCPIGQLLSSAMAPMSTLSGGMIQGCCPASAIAQGLQQPADSAEGAAARIKADEAGVAARRAAIRYLGTVDCNVWPEAEKALCDALLFDKSECVRLEAALALQRGCCCTKVVVKALTDCITGKSKPVECSERVKSAAAVALAHCAIPAGEPIPVEERKDEIKKVDFTPAEYYKRVAATPRSEVMEQAQKALAQLQSGEINVGPGTSGTPMRPGSVAQILSNAFSTGWSGETMQSAQSTANGPGQTGSTATASATSERKPFFDNLTQALKGKQNGLPSTVSPNSPSSSTIVVYDAPVKSAVPVVTASPAPVISTPQSRTPAYPVYPVYSVYDLANMPQPAATLPAPATTAPATLPH